MFVKGTLSPNEFKTAQEADTMCAGILHKLNKDKLTSSQYSLSKDGVLQIAQNQIVVPKRLRKLIIQAVHDTKIGGRREKEKTLEMIK